MSLQPVMPRSRPLLSALLATAPRMARLLHHWWFYRPERRYMRGGRSTG
ncbi:hypothetical protein ACVMLK_17310 [Teichococcus aerofrigidensis]